MIDTRALLYLLQVANGSFPSGAFSHSYGLETLIHDGRITDADTLADVACLWLRYGVATSDGGAVAIAVQATRANDVAMLTAVDEVLTALKLTRETREASVKMGQAFVRTISPRYRTGHYATAFGVAAADAGVRTTDALVAFLHSAVYGIVGVAARIMPLGQFDAQRVVTNAWPCIVECAEIARGLGLDDLSAPATVLDIASMRHERLYTRLCMS